jgi:hypothetical protein
MGSFDRQFHDLEIYTIRIQNQSAGLELQLTNSSPKQSLSFITTESLLSLHGFRRNLR